MTQVLNFEENGKCVVVQEEAGLLYLSVKLPSGKTFVEPDRTAVAVCDKLWRDYQIDIRGEKSRVLSKVSKPATEPKYVDMHSNGDINQFPNS